MCHAAVLRTNGERVTKMNTFMTVPQVRNAAAVILLHLSTRNIRVGLQ